MFKYLLRTCLIWFVRENTQFPKGRAIRRIGNREFTGIDSPWLRN